ncbi:peptide-binding protein [Sulfurimonas sp. C5]|uniref:peptide-binding protein n=1 Tax=Sulfurimonas sp. C5 TaxID=3036947 RepID=UPI002455F3F6|nr:peptide-binding protein [Sulfurimonas sp. C5]MDH4944401.1 peptide-binding protein [Sulfurimonas sp. C5]
MKFLIIFIFTFNLLASTLHLATSANPSRLNPLLATDSSSGEIAGFIFNGLLKYDKDNKEIIGDLAKNYYFKDNKTLVFELKHGVKWHDGEEFTAKDVLFTYKTLISDKISSPYSAGFRFVSDVKVLDKYTVEVKYTKPYFKALETWMMGIIPEHILKDDQNIMNSKFNTHPIGTGAYKLEKLEFSKDIELSAFDEYFEGRAKIDKIAFHVIADSMTSFLMLKSAKLDLGSLEPMAYERQLNKEFFEKFNIYEKIALSYTYLGFNLRKKKFQDPNVRKALSLAINRQELVDILFFQHAKVCTGPFLPGSAAFNENVKAPKQDINEAKRLLKSAGYDEKNPFTFEIATSNSSSIRPYAAEILQNQLARAGVIVKLRVMEWQAFLNTVVFPHKFDTVLLGWGLSPTPDPYMFWHSDNDKVGGFNLVGYKNKKIDSMIEKTQSMVDREALAKSWQEMFSIITHDNPYLFLYIPNSITAVNKDIKNIKPALGGIWHNYIEWEK